MYVCIFTRWRDIHMLQNSPSKVTQLPDNNKSRDWTYCALRVLIISEGLRHYYWQQGGYFHSGPFSLLIFTYLFFFLLLIHFFYLLILLPFLFFFFFYLFLFLWWLWRFINYASDETVICEGVGIEEYFVFRNNQCETVQL